MERRLDKPARSLEAPKVDVPPGRIEFAFDIADVIGILPLGAAHDVVIVIAESIAIEADSIQQFGIVITIVSDVPNMEYSRRTPPMLPKCLNPAS